MAFIMEGLTINILSGAEKLSRKKYWLSFCTISVGVEVLVKKISYCMYCVNFV